MNFYELFEKKEEDKKQQDVTISDPKAALALKQARAKYTYADSDLEAFVKMTQDKEEEEDKEIAKLDRDTERQERKIKSNDEHIRDLEAKEKHDAAEISKLEKENDIQDQRLQTLSAKEKQYEKMAQSYNDWAKQIGNELADLENRLAKVKGYKPSSRPIPTAPAAPAPTVDEPYVSVYTKS